MSTTHIGRDPVFTLADRLEKSRKVAGLLQQQMADRLLVSRTTVNNWERGHTQPSDRRLAAWADVTGVRVAWLRGWISDDEPGGAVTRRYQLLAA